MISRSTQWAWLLFALVLSATILLAKQWSLEAARRSAVRMTIEEQRLALRQIEAQQQRLKASQPAREEMDLARRQHAEAEALRRRLAAIQRQARAASDSGANSDSGPTTQPVDAWIYAGRATPQTTIESVLWSASRGEIERLATLIAFSPVITARAYALFSQLPESAQQEFGTPQRVIATLLAGGFPESASAMTTLGISQSGGSAAMTVRVDRSDGQARTSLLQLQQGPDGWQLLVPSNVMKNYEETLAGKTHD